MALSKAQKNVIHKMQNGWQLSRDDEIVGGWHIQQGGAGRGGKIKTVHTFTAQAMLRRGLICVDERKFPIVTYKLTEKALSMAT